MQWEPKLVNFGIRHKRLFGFLGRAGDIIDAIISLEGTKPFPEGCFTKIGWPTQVTARIQNDDQTLVVECNIDGLVLTVDLEETGLTRDQAKDAFATLSEIALKISGGHKTVDRIGIIDNYSFHNPSPGRRATHAITKLEGLGNPVDFALRASFRTPTEDGLVKGNVNDWKNTIIHVVTEKEDEDSDAPDVLRVSIDYQIYFRPMQSFSLSLIEEHYREFLTRIQKLQSGPFLAIQDAR